MVDSSCFIMAENTENSSTISDEMDQSQHKKAVSDLLADKGARHLMIEKLKASSHVAKESTITAFSTISGYNAGGSAWSAFPMQFPFAAPFPPFWGPTHTSAVADTPQEIPLRGSARLQDQPGSSSSQGQAEEDEEEDVVDLLDESEILELVQFDPTVGGDNTWEAGETINDFLQKHFKRILQPEEWEL